VIPRHSRGSPSAVPPFLPPELSTGAVDGPHTAPSRTHRPQPPPIVNRLPPLCVTNHSHGFHHATLHSTHSLRHLTSSTSPSSPLSYYPALPLRTLLKKKKDPYLTKSRRRIFFFVKFLLLCFAPRCSFFFSSDSNPCTPPPADLALLSIHVDIL